MARGILSFGAYLPRSRLQRQAIYEANRWFNPGLRGLAKGERAVANWDEDSITLGVAAARDALCGQDRSALTQLLLASTTQPFAERQNAAVVASALNLGSTLQTADLTGSLRAGTSALLLALQGRQTALVVGADVRLAKAASAQEMHYGDGAAAYVVGEGAPLATLLGAHSETVDFVHQYRMQGRDHDYAWEERWVRDEGYLKIVPQAVAAVLKQCGVAPAQVQHFCMPGTLARIAPAVAKKCGLPDAAVSDNLGAVCGDTGAAHPLLMLAAALEVAQPGERILVVGFGEGADALLFEAQPALTQARAHLAVNGQRGVKSHLALRREDRNYLRYLSFNKLLDMERGMRAEVDKPTPLSVAYRNRDMLQALIGGRCTACATVQYPRQRYCVNPACNALDSQQDHAFAESTAKVLTYTADALTYSPDPPAYFGMVAFEGGGRMMLDFTEVDAATMAVGLAMRLAFRIKDKDPQRGFVRYFWKATAA